MRKNQAPARALRVNLVAAAVASCFATANALANPTGATVVNGAVSMSTPAPGQLHITNSPNSILHWNGFSIGVGELTRFIQQSPSSAVLNRVITGNPSEILGQLLSNGRVFLINPNGIVFGPGSMVDVAGLVASSLNLSDADFLLGSLNFQPVPGAGPVINQGTIMSLAGGPVYLVGPAVTNGGVIDNQGGEVILAAGNSVEIMNPETPEVSVSVTAPGNQALNLGAIMVGSGRAGMFAGIVNQGGSISATSAVLGSDGSIRLVATDTTTLAAGSVTVGGPLDIDTGNLVVAGVATSGQQTIRATGGVQVQNGSLSGSNGQTIEAQYVEVEASAGFMAGIFHFGGEQRITTTGANAAGEGLAVRNAGGSFATIQNQAGAQSIDVAGGLTVRAGPTGSAFISTFGDQTVSAGSILLQGGSAGSGRSAQIVASSGSQTVNAGAGGITLIGGSSAGSNNFAQISQGTLHPAFTQTVSSAGPVLLDSGDAGTLNFTIIRAFGGHQSFSAGSTTLQAGAGGAGNFAAIQAQSQDVNIQGDLAFISGGSATSGTSGGGAQMGGRGGAAASPTNLSLAVSGNLTMTGGSVSGAAIGGGLVNNEPNNIAIAVGGNVALNPGTAPGASARIGARADSPAGGNIEITAGGSIALNSSAPDRYSLIRTAGDVTLAAQQITQGPDAKIQANALTVGTQQGASLAGANSVNAFNAMNAMFGDVRLHNSSPLLTVSGIDAAGSTLNLQQDGNLSVTGLVISGPQTIGATGHLAVLADDFTSGQLSAAGGQQISARTMEVTAQGSGSAFVSNNMSGDQSITVAGGGAGAGLDVRTLSGTGFAIVSNNVLGGTQNIQVVDAEHLAVEGQGSGGASINLLNGTQSISITGGGANALRLGASGAQGFSQLSASNQTIVAGAAGAAGAAGEAGSITIIGSAGNARLAGMVSQPGIGGSQTVSTSGTLRVTGGSALAQPNNFPAGIFHNGTGQQTINAQSIVLQGGATGSGNSAQIGANNGTQLVNAGSISLTGGALGTGNSTQLRANLGSQSISAGQMMLTAGSGGTSNFAVVTAPLQSIAVAGDLSISGGGSLSSPSAGGGALMGGGGARPTNLALSVGGNLTMNGGSAAGSVIGGNNTNTQRNDIVLNVGGDVVLNAGTAFASRIGSAAGLGSGGNIDVTASGKIALNSAAPGNGSAIRTTENVTLRAREITQGADATIQADTLTLETQEGALLVGANAVNALRATNAWFGDVALHNSSPLLTVADVRNFAGAFVLRQQGDVLVNGGIFSGPQSIDVSGGLVVQNDPGMFAQVIATGGQAIRAGHVEVNGTGGGSAAIANFGGEQSIETISANAAGEGLAVRAFDGGFAVIDSPQGAQSIIVRNAERMVVGGGNGFATISAFGMPQSIVLTGAGANALVMGGGSAGQAIIFGGDQTVQAGQDGESGSITLLGNSAGFSTAIIANQLEGGTQTIGTPGALTVAGGTAPMGPDSGIFADGGVLQQSVNAGSIALTGGASGSGNGAVIVSNTPMQHIVAGAGGIVVAGGTGTFNNDAGIYANNGSQVVEAGLGGISLIGGAAGANNFVQINQQSSSPTATQTVVSEGPVLVQGGDAGTFNFAMIRSFGGQQTLSFGDTTLLAGASGLDNFAVIQGRNQEVAVHGDLALTGRGSAGSPTLGGGARIGGLGGTALTATNLALSVDGDLTMAGGSVAGTGALLGNSTGVTAPTNIDVIAGGDITLDGGTAPNAFATIGSRAANLAGGEIDIVAGGTIALNSSAPDAAAVIRTADGVTLRAQQVTQGPDARIEAGSLMVETSQGASLVGANRVSQLAMLNSVSGEIAFNNAKELLTVTGINQVSNGALSLSQSGNLQISGNVSSGAQTISATGDITVAPNDGQGMSIDAAGAQAISAGGTLQVQGGSATQGHAQINATGPIYITTGGDLALTGGEGREAHALLFGTSNINLAVGGAVRLNAGTGEKAWARIQSETRDTMINIYFPNLSAGGIFVNGIEGLLRDGLTGLLSGSGVAVPGHTLILDYGQ